MDFIATALGLQLPTLRARACLQQQYNKCGPGDRSDPKIVWDSCDQDLWDVPDKLNCDDDETASTLTESSEESFSSSEPLSPCVRFAQPVVTAVYLRPATDRREKGDLYYNENDYRQFRLDFRQSLYRKEPTVTFNDTPQVHTLPVVDNKDEIYYSPAELKKFLEDFILSLDDK